jgi:hypothetical protein
MADKPGSWIGAYEFQIIMVMPKSGIGVSNHSPLSSALRKGRLSRKFRFLQLSSGMSSLICPRMARRTRADPGKSAEGLCRQRCHAARVVPGEASR